MSDRDPGMAEVPGAARRRFASAGYLLFLFIPAVLFLFVRHPRPVGLSLLGGIALMAIHRRLARPYFRRALAAKCAWCNRSPVGAPAAVLELAAGGETFAAHCCPAHRAPAGRFFAFLGRYRWPLRIGIFVPLLALLASLAATALGGTVPLAAVTAAFQLAVGVTVVAAAFAYRPGAEPPAGEPVPVPFPVHNFFLLGVRSLLWVFRLVGIAWIAVGLWFFAARPAAPAAPGAADGAAVRAPRSPAP
jgi:hypothetical protein